MAEIVVWCDHCYQVFFKKLITYDGENEMIFMEQLKKEYREHRMSDNCRKLIKPIAKVEVNDYII